MVAGSPNAARWLKAFAKAKGAKPSKPAAIERYTNLSLASIWEKFDCQTQMLCREAMIPLMGSNPELMAKNVASFGAATGGEKK
ncbi:unnamed protein product [Amoebophrya sp. A25]|nr:unnamed protein product [Amoebophrya sp. A25]|eukprot:GSA25T00008587001.1